MKSIKALAIVAATAACVGTAQAGDESQAYVNVGVDTLEFDYWGIGGKVGYQFGDYFGVEGQGSIGVIDKTETVFGTDVDVGYDYFVGAFAVGFIPLGENFDIIGRVGYYATEVSAEAQGNSVSEKGDGFAFGAGAQYMWDDVNGIRVDYTYLDGDGGHADAASVAYVRKF